MNTFILKLFCFFGYLNYLEFGRQVETVCLTIRFIGFLLLLVEYQKVFGMIPHANI